MEIFAVRGSDLAWLKNISNWSFSFEVFGYEWLTALVRDLQGPLFCLIYMYQANDSTLFLFPKDY